ncbi:hypothetical protein MPNT_150007 [Candidatus Methylacidithermus pantelleriae]|uniref:Uncharacterized protein n=1 Tax=Candidatus Methylacidithermus pantelleriae TaxID=2744239 RepID=A0A8J2BH51_9BACT|nr:hypothetical protein MPNT_150007 [Candidatus Methylacidithermus pantelleriae]
MPPVGRYFFPSTTDEFFAIEAPVFFTLGVNEILGEGPPSHCLCSGISQRRRRAFR